MTLSENRAKSVMEFLIAQGISEKRLSAKGFGESKPKLPNSSAVNRAKNRRTEFLFIDQ
jgi:outer membrane protein OmpA-like peptidoglycan-associated protein